MKLHINDDYRVITDKYCWVLQRKKYKKNKKEFVWKNFYYCNSLESVLRNLYELQIRLIDNNKDDNINIIQEKIEKFEREIRELIKNISIKMISAEKTPPLII